MNKSATFGILIGIAVVLAGSIIFAPSDTLVRESVPVYDSGFTYYDIELIQGALAKQNIVVSTPVAITDHTADQYCTYLKDGQLKTTNYCITTAVQDSDGNLLGNINLGGELDSPVLAVANLETDTLDSNDKQVVFIFETVIEILVCDCWEDPSGDFESVSAWINATQTFYLDSDMRNIKSKVDNLDKHNVLLEITGDKDSVLQTLIILK